MPKPRTMMTLRDRKLHDISLEIARVYREVYWGPENEMKEDLLNAFRNVRRHITEDEHGNRWRADEAQDVISGMAP